jgi:hypothetical protein
MSNWLGGRCAISGSLLVAGAMAFASLASPILPENTSAWTNTPRNDGVVSDDYSRSLRSGKRSTATDQPALPAASIHDDIRVDRDIPGRPEFAPEMNLRGPGESADLPGIDDGAFIQSSLLRNELLRGFGGTQGARPGAPGSGLNGWNRGSSAPDMLGEAVDNALRMARDAIFDGNDTASFSVFGIELSVTHRGDRPVVSINGDDVLGANPYFAESNEAWQEAAASTAGYSGITVGSSPGLAAGQYSADGPDRKVSMADIYTFLTNPMMILGTLVALGIWLLLSVLDHSRS